MIWADIVWVETFDLSVSEWGFGARSIQSNTYVSFGVKSGVLVVFVFG